MMNAPDAIGELALLADSQAQRAAFERVEITIAGAGGQGSTTPGSAYRPLARCWPFMRRAAI